MAYYYNSERVEVDKVKKLISHVLYYYNMEIEQGLFRLTMVSSTKKHIEPLFNLYSFSHFWHYLNSFVILRTKPFPKYYEMSEVALVNDERCF